MVTAKIVERCKTKRGAEATEIFQNSQHRKAGNAVMVTWSLGNDVKSFRGLEACSLLMAAAEVNKPTSSSGNTVPLGW
jgi:hypothetical protein